MITVRTMFVLPLAVAVTLWSLTPRSFAASVCSAGAPSAGAGALLAQGVVMLAVAVT